MKHLWGWTVLWIVGSLIGWGAGLAVNFFSGIIGQMSGFEGFILYIAVVGPVILAVISAPFGYITLLGPSPLKQQLGGS